MLNLGYRSLFLRKPFSQLIFGIIVCLSSSTSSVAVTYAITPNPASVNENAGHLTFTVTRSSSASAATVYVSTVQDQGYTNSGYYNGWSTRALSFQRRAEHGTVPLTINDVGLTSGSETFSFIVQQPTPPAATRMRRPTSSPSTTTTPLTTYSISPNPASVNENAGSLTFTVSRSSSAGAATVYVSTSAGPGLHQQRLL